MENQAPEVPSAQSSAAQIGQNSGEVRRSSYKSVAWYL